MGFAAAAHAGTKTWDARHDTSQIEVTVVYFVPADRTPLADWRDRVAYYCRRIDLFHRREFQGQSTLKTIVRAEPVTSRLTTEELRRGDADRIFFRSLRESESQIGFPGPKRDGVFPILLVLSDINWRPLDDFYRLKPHEGQLVFEGNYNSGEHFPGAASGGARATYLADRGVGWGLVSADGWRVPYRGSDCVIYHEGCGHTVGLPHPAEGDGSVMSLGQYQGWIHESWLNEDQKKRLGWQPAALPANTNSQLELFSRFRALPSPRVPNPGQEIELTLNWPEKASVASLRVRYQTSLDGPWIDVPQTWDGDAPRTARLGRFDRETPVSYRVEAELKDKSTAELWGYFQVRSSPERNPQPSALPWDLMVGAATLHPDAEASVSELPKSEVDLLALADPATCWQQGPWTKEAGKLISPKQYGARLELPYTPPEEYRLTLIVEPLDDPDGLILGQRSGNRRFVTLFNYTPQAAGLSAIENIDGQNVGNETTFTGHLFRKDRLSLVVVTVTRSAVTMAVDGRTIVAWKGEPKQLSLSDYWKTPDDSALFLGAYDCRYRFHRVTLEPIRGTGKIRQNAAGK